MRLFYDDTRVRRHRGLPAPVAHNLYGKGSVHALDDLEHRERKRLFLEVTGPEQVGDLAERVATKWDVELDSWVRTGRGTVIPSATRVLGEAVQEWAGVPEPPVVMRRRARDLVQIVDNSLRPGLPWLRAWWARRRADRWATGLIDDVRRGARRPRVGSAAEVLAFARDRTGQLLPAGTAAVELLNVLRPTVAVSYFAAFAALELETNPDLNDDCATGDPESVRTFSEEVRRMSPFVPLLAARSRCPFAWQGHRVRAGDRLLLDVYGTNRDPVAWQDGDTFDPGRFRSPNARHRADFVPQGGGPADTGHRCPGEGITLALLDEMIPPDGPTRLADPPGGQSHVAATTAGPAGERPAPARRTPEPSAGAARLTCSADQPVAAGVRSLEVSSVRRSRMIRLSSRDTCIWVTPMSSAISCWVRSSKKRM